MGCRIVHSASCEAGLKSQREVIVPSAGDGEASRNHGWTRTHGRAQGCRTSALTLMRKFCITPRPCEKDKKGRRLRHKPNERRRASTGERKEELESLASLYTSTDDLAQRWTCSFASKQSAKQVAETEDDHCKSGEKLLNIALARYTAATVLSATAKGLERNVVRTSPVFSLVPFGTEPLFVNTESKSESETQMKMKVSNFFELIKNRNGKILSRDIFLQLQISFFLF